jgi:hypothetical protein
VFTSWTHPIRFRGGAEGYNDILGLRIGPITDDSDVPCCRISSFLLMTYCILQLKMLAYGLGPKDEAAFVDNFIIEL